MANDDRNQKQAAKQEKMPPNSATNLHKNMAVGMARTAAEDKALTSVQVERKER